MIASLAMLALGTIGIFEDTATCEMCKDVDFENCFHKSGKFSCPKYVQSKSGIGYQNTYLDLGES